MSGPPAQHPFVPRPPRSGPPTGRLVAVVVGVIFAIGLLTCACVLVMGYLFASRVRVSTVEDDQGRERSLRVDTPLGRLRVEKNASVDPKLLGIPIYPGAVPVESGAKSARIELDLDFADKYLRVMAVELETPDPIEKVINFYREETADFLISHRSDGRVEFRWQQGRLKKVVGIQEKSRKTRIALANIGEPEAN